MCGFGFSLGLGVSVVPWHSLRAADPPDTWRHPHCNKKNKNKKTETKKSLVLNEKKTEKTSLKADILKPHWPLDRAKRLFYNSLKEQRCSALSASLSLRIHFKAEKFSDWSCCVTHSHTRWCQVCELLTLMTLALLCLTPQRTRLHRFIWLQRTKLHCRASSVFL